LQCHKDDGFNSGQADDIIILVVILRQISRLLVFFLMWQIIRSAAVKHCQIIISVVSAQFQRMLKVSNC
jgi:hypothetical protein